MADLFAVYWGVRPLITPLVIEGDECMWRDGGTAILNGTGLEDYLPADTQNALARPLHGLLHKIFLHGAISCICPM